MLRMEFLGSLLSLGEEQGLGICIDSANIGYLPEVEHVAEALQIDPFRLAVGFGNLELIASVSPERVNEALELANHTEAHCTILGRFDDKASIRLLDNHEEAIMSNFDNQRFTSDSQFTAGLDASEERLLSRSLTQSGELSK